MTILTILELLDNYPKNILVEAHREKKDSLYSVCCYMTREGDIHKLMLSTNPVFKDHNEAVNAMHFHIKETILAYSLQTKMYKGLDIFTDEEIDKFIDRTLDLENIDSENKERAKSDFMILTKIKKEREVKNGCTTNKG